MLENRDGLRGAVWCRGAKLNFAENLLTRADGIPVVMMDMPPPLDFMALKSSRNLGNRMTVIHISKGRTKHMVVGALLVRSIPGSDLLQELLTANVGRHRLSVRRTHVAADVAGPIPRRHSYCPRRRHGAHTQTI